MAFSYEAPDPSEASQRAAAPCQFSLRDAASREEYREWRILAEAFCTANAQLRFLEPSIRNAIIASWGQEFELV